MRYQKISVIAMISASVLMCAATAAFTSVPIPQTSSEDIVTEDVPGNDLSISVTDDTVSIIGGADGPTSIFIAGKRGTFFSETEEDTGAKESQETN